MREINRVDDLQNPLANRICRIFNFGPAELYKGHTAVIKEYKRRGGYRFRNTVFGLSEDIKNFASYTAILYEMSDGDKVIAFRYGLFSSLVPRIVWLDAEPSEAYFAYMGRRNLLMLAGRCRTLLSALDRFGEAAEFEYKLADMPEKSVLKSFSDGVEKVFRVSRSERRHGNKLRKQNHVKPSLTPDLITYIHEAEKTLLYYI